MRAHTSHVSQQDSGETSTIEETRMQGSAQTTAVHATPSFPPSASLQHPNQISERSRAYGRSKYPEVYLSAQPPSDSTQTSQGAFGKRHHARPMTPAPRPGPSTSRGGTSSATSAFSFRAPNQSNNPVHRGFQNDHTLHPVPTRHHPGNRGFVGFAPHSTQAPAQMSTVPPRSST